MRRPRPVLLGSALLHPSVWEPVSRALSSRGWDASIAPAPRGDIDSTAVLDSYLRALPADEPVVVVAHSNAGAYVPPVISRRAVAAAVFVDAVLPTASGTQPLAPPSLLEAIAPLADAEGLLPRWTDWFDDADVAALFPDADARARVAALAPRMPLALLQESLEIAPGWHSTPNAYLGFGDGYATEQAIARSLGWPVRVLDGLHLHQLVDPAGVAAAITELVEELLG